ncbi:anthranilate synthase component I [Aneurinibacillus sp. Ricciae_BoGa-3]|uniref:anthranilate synthase component I n=1 Tax=Aneurinibacillus sp. Ricciae_BoGa-3 TaxID=3022697 RepID=UPI00233FA495|nr:anthranilate synthase component I [Aneurinibacillus sp. Ricciae_BoGa-3]WCK56084.1 anthranilate synthase component I [Aneurinibacillus sp. Ricciae_BoGa-3]
MYTPELKEIHSLPRSYNFIPIRYSFLADQVTPIQLYRTVRSDNTFLLESVEGGNRWGRYSFIGLHPFMTLRGGEGVAEFEYRSGKKEAVTANPLSALRAKLESFRSPKLPGFPPFTGGAVGFLGYETAGFIENLPRAGESPLNLPDIHLYFADEIIAYDHLKQEVQVIVNMQLPEGAGAEDINREYTRCCARIQEIVGIITRPVKVEQRVENIPYAAPAVEVNSNMTQHEFESKVERAKEYIKAGDIFQVVLSQRFHTPTTTDPLLVYRILRVTNPSPYMYYFQKGGTAVVGTSPELLVKVTEGTVEVRPIAGTRPRGQTPKEDQALAAELLADEKECAEHLMLLDLGRNDVGRVASPGSVHVSEQMVMEYYSRVMHMVSHVSGTLAQDKQPFDALLSAFPAGTVSGSPKIRAMEVISELEGEARGLYAGAVGYFSFNGNLDSCITIRTIIFQDGQAYVQAGAGIVADSVPSLEYEETRNKAKAMLYAIQLAEHMTRKEEMSADV